MTPPRSTNLPVIIVGAGPYGLSLAAHLREAGIPFRIFGHRMQSWATQMPAGMKLKSDGFASNLSAGSTPFTLEDFCRLTNRPYHPTRIPVALEDFVAYGQEFAARFVPNLEPCDVVSIDRLDQRIDYRLDSASHCPANIFRLTLSTGEVLHSGHVILATGRSLFHYVPQRLAALSKDLVTHTTDHHDFSAFAGRDVVVLGRGASALNAAALLHEAGSRVTLLTRKPRIHIHSAGSAGPRSLFERLKSPASPLGHSLRSWMACTAPGLFHALPEPFRRLLVYKHLGPSGGPALKNRVLGKIPMLLGWSIASTELAKIERSGRSETLVRLLLTNEAGEQKQLLTSHIIAGTGFRVALARMRFLSESLRSVIRTGKTGSPRLTRNFQSTVPGLYFIGPASSAAFGPLQRFAAGSEYAACRVTRHLLHAFAEKSAPARISHQAFAAQNADRNGSPAQPAR